MSKKVAQNIGAIFAHIQNFFDGAFTLLFKKLKKAGEKKTKVDTTKFQGKIFKAGQNIASFIGDVGESFYENYDELKQNKSKKKTKK